MAIVLPQGRLNNATDKTVRDFVAEHARILAVVGLHGNTFKPHTGTKTSVLFCQKWNDDPEASPRLRCPKVDDYPVFFAVSQQGGKDTSGEYVYLTDDRGWRLYDLHDHPMVDHDLFNLRAYLADQLEQRLAVAKTVTQRQAIRDAHAAKLPFIPDRPGIADAFREWGQKQHFGFCFDNVGEA
jgi:type I restriction enzyme M protein